MNGVFCVPFYVKINQFNYFSFNGYPYYPSLPNDILLHTHMRYQWHLDFSPHLLPFHLVLRHHDTASSAPCPCFGHCVHSLYSSKCLFIQDRGSSQWAPLQTAMDHLGAMQTLLVRQHILRNSIDLTSTQTEEKKGTSEIGGHLT